MVPEYLDLDAICLLILVRLVFQPLGLLSPSSIRPATLNAASSSISSLKIRLVHAPPFRLDHWGGRGGGLSAPYFVRHVGHEN